MIFILYSNFVENVEQGIYHKSGERKDGVYTVQLDINFAFY